MSTDDAQFQGENDDSYIPSNSGSKVAPDEVPVVQDDKVEDGLQGDQDSDAQLANDESEAISEDNIIDDRTRGAKPQGPGYSEGPDEDDLPEVAADGSDGQSSTAAVPSSLTTLVLLTHHFGRILSSALAHAHGIAFSLVLGPRSRRIAQHIPKMPSIARCLTLFGILLFATAQEAVIGNVTLPAPLSIDPAQNWDGFDGPWSSFTIGIGTPAQWVRVFVSTASQQTWSIYPAACTYASDPAACLQLRGWDFNSTESSTWDPIGTFSLYIEQNLGFFGNAEYGLDTVTLGGPGGSGPTERNATVGNTASADFFLGIFGVHPKPTNFTSFNDPEPSYMTLLKNDGSIPSLSFGYTAGARYRYSGRLASLTLGGYDQSLFEENNITYSFAPNNERDLVVGLQAITTNVSSEALLPTPIYAFIDSTVGQLWLPMDACEKFEQVFGLTYDNATQLYLVNSTLHAHLVELNPNITFTIGQDPTSGDSVDIVLPYDAFNLTATAPFQNMSSSSLYFPLRRATQDNQYTLGRTFLQEAYLSVDWERQLFNVSQNIWTVTQQKDIVTIFPTNTTILENNPAFNHSSKSSLSGGAIGGIVVGAVAAVALIAVLVTIICCRRRVRGIALLRRKDASDAGADHSAATDSSDASLHGTQMSQTGVLPKAELDAMPPVFGKHEGALDDATLRPGSSSLGGSSPLGTLIGTASIGSPTTPRSAGFGPRGGAVQVGGLQEVENSEREVYEMPGDLPAPVEMPEHGQLAETRKERDIAREREYNGVNPSEQV
ncbi:hypothetical protein FH972_022430 [Carpinus fangiana]|uniref:Peptidase A1 domain-containing protein n=1 Tax=Carpinus fangiana TaxID=176857 RepID=A0A5N6KSJ3_9ROSI|nr:hypothetical protein FH972_022430 [Carpinus fangiana]